MNIRQLYAVNKVYVFAVAGFIVLLFGLFFLRNLMLQKAISAFTHKLAGRGFESTWKDPHFKGIRTIFFDEISISSQSKNSDVFIDSFSVKVRVLPLVIKQIRIGKITCNSILINYTDIDSGAAKVRNVDSTNIGSRLNQLNFAEFATKNLRRFFHYLPGKIYVRNLELKYLFAENLSRAEIKELVLKRDGSLSASLFLQGNDTSVIIPVDGKLDKGKSLIAFNLTDTSNSLLPVPFLQDKYGFATGFDSLEIFLDLSERQRQRVTINGLFNFNGFELQGQRISTDTITIDKFHSAFNIHLGSDYVEVDSSSSAYLNDIKINPYLKISFQPGPTATFRILPQQWSAETFFGSLPKGMFTSVNGIKSKGTLNYHLNFSADFNNPESLYFDTRLTSDDFEIIAYGTDDYRLINGSFRHNVYEKGRLSTSFIVGPENGDFVPVSAISPFLRSAVMTSEDGSFYFHNGFNPGAFRESIATNIKEKRFARGGSTITMQLVKNVFLTRNKTLARKIEEALIVWIIEQKNLVSKERMYEVYLNIIEWGPGIYGINQASHFYFNKTPADLTLNESIFLASIVPHPKWYKYSFVDYGELKPFYGVYFNRMKELMVHKNFINAYDTVGIKPDVLLTGAAAAVFATDTTVMDSIFMDLLFIPPDF